MQAYCTLRNETKWNEICTLRNNLYFAKWKSVLCEMKCVLCEMKCVLCEMKICTLKNENLYFAKWNLYFVKKKSLSLLCEMKSVRCEMKYVLYEMKYVLCEMKICILQEENLTFFAKWNSLLSWKTFVKKHLRKELGTFLKNFCEEASANLLFSYKSWPWHTFCFCLGIERRILVTCSIFVLFVQLLLSNDSSLYILKFYYSCSDRCVF